MWLYQFPVSFLYVRRGNRRLRSYLPVFRVSLVSGLGSFLCLCVVVLLTFPSKKIGFALSASVGMQMDANADDAYTEGGTV